jgi:hypothetical protein
MNATRFKKESCCPNHDPQAFSQFCRKTGSKIRVNPYQSPNEMTGVRAVITP